MDDLQAKYDKLVEEHNKTTDILRDIIRDFFPEMDADNIPVTDAFKSVELFMLLAVGGITPREMKEQSPVRWEMGKITAKAILDIFKIGVE